MNILIALEDLRTGGAQTFSLRLAQALHAAGHTVTLYSHYAHHINQELVRQLAPDVPVVAYGTDNPLLDLFLRKADGGGRRLGLLIPWREKLVIRHLRRTIQKLRPDVVNSHTIKSDYVTARALENLPIPLVITMHGCYELFMHSNAREEVTPKGNYALEHAASFVYLTEKNLEIFTEPGVRSLANLPHAKIYNGFDGQVSTDKSQHTRATLGIPADARVFVMVARGIPEKGWAHAVNSFMELQQVFPQLHLLLVGESDYLSELKATHPHPHLHFVGFSRNPIDWVDICDVGLLPSYFHAESLPNSIAEYLSCGKPVIASRIGEVPHMLASEEGTAGFILDQAEWRLTDPGQLTEAMRQYLTNDALLAEHQRRAHLAFKKFEMQQCIEAYTALYGTSIASMPAAAQK